MEREFSLWQRRVPKLLIFKPQTKTYAFNNSFYFLLFSRQPRPTHPFWRTSEAAAHERQRRRRRMDHAVKATRGRPLNTLRFENDELECLYQRYTLKLQRFSVLGVVALVVVLCGVMAALSLSFNNAPTFQVIALEKKVSFQH